MTENIRNRIKITPLGGLLPVLVLCLLCATSTWGDVKAGVAAYERKDYKTALNQLRLPAKQGDAEAQYHLGRMYGFGYGVVQDYVEAAKWYRKAAQQNHLRAMLALHLLYNVDKVYKEFHKAAEQGNAEAQFHLGVMYDDGYGVVQDDVAAVKWFTKAAQQNHARAQYNLGLMYANLAAGVVQNYVAAVKWFTKAAQQNHASAQVHLGLMYQFGMGVVQNYVTALKWYTKAAQQGDASAQYNLGWMYQFGMGVVQNYVAAVKWLHKSRTTKPCQCPV